MEKGKVDMELIRRYVRGELSPREMYALERQAQADPMLMDIILGMESDTLAAHDSHLVDVRQRIAARTASEPPKTVVRRLAPTQRWAVAASILAILTVGTWWFTRYDTTTQREDTLAAVQEAAPQQQMEKQSAPEPAPIGVESEADATPPRTPAAIAKATTEPAAVQEAPTIAPTPEAEAPKTTKIKVERLAMAPLNARTNATPLDSIAIAINDDSSAHLALADVNRPSVIRIRGITPQPLDEGQLRTIIGKVVNEETQEPLMGVNIQIGNQLGIITDQEGRFMATDTSNTLITRYIGYESDTTRIDGLDSVLIAMRPDNMALSEVVVIGQHQGRPMPKDGWTAYRQYLGEAVKRASDQAGTVDLSFTVNKAGRPSNFTVTNTTNEALDKLAIDIVRNGPRWVRGENDERKATLQVVF